MLVDLGITEVYSSRYRPESKEGKENNDMLDERKIRLVVTSAMSKYASRNDGRKGMAKDDVIEAVAKFGGDCDDVRRAMIEGIIRIAPDHRIHFS